MRSPPPRSTKSCIAWQGLGYYARAHQPAWLRPLRCPASSAGNSPMTGRRCGCCRDRRLYRRRRSRLSRSAARKQRSTVMSNGWWRASSPNARRCRRRSRVCGRSRRLWCRIREPAVSPRRWWIWAPVLCTPRRPRCVLCPWRGELRRSRAEGIAENLPARTEKPERPLRYGVAFWLSRGDRAGVARGAARKRGCSAA